MQMSFRGLLESGLIDHVDHIDQAGEIDQVDRKRGTGLRWVMVRIPFDPYKAWPVRKALRVRGTINGFAFRTSLFGSRDNGHLLLVNRTMQKQAGVAPGRMADIVLEPDVDERSAEPPAELAKLLKQDRALKKYFEQLSYSMRKYMLDTISKVKSSEARVRSAERMAEMMLLAMEGEEVLPPILQVGFRRETQALAGWHAMTPIQRRTQLLAIFHCQGAESRAKRAAKTIQEAVRIAKKLQAP